MVGTNNLRLGSSISETFKSIDNLDYITVVADAGEYEDSRNGLNVRELWYNVVVLRNLELYPT